MEKPLLPSGLYDLLPPFARMQSRMVEQLLCCFESFGYEQVIPPLLEFEETLLKGRGEALASQTFRMMDPLSQAMMGFRADITMQIARIAASRLESAPRPLRLCYAGSALRVKPEQLRTERQIYQIGVELIGSDAPAADAEAILVAVQALSRIGIAPVTVDLNLPGIIAALTSAGELTDNIRDAIDRKDSAAILNSTLTHRELLAALMRASGPASKALPALAALKLPGEVAEQCARLREVVQQLEASGEAMLITIDPLENRGFEYHTGISFSLFVEGVKNEIGRGGHYLLDHGAVGSIHATGFTLYGGTLLRALPLPDATGRIYLAPGTPYAEGAQLRAQGHITVHGMGAEDTRALGCTHIYENGKIRTL